ncbi:metallophosphoesterase [Verrucomicrobiales bacterium]|nr:metallophosphoesterase [Verrucomicrobiales bacterium]
MIDRRRFVRRVAIGSLSLGPGSCFVESRAGSLVDEWSLEVVGDIHYDQLEHHDMSWVKREKPNSVSQIENYSRITRENYPVFLQALKREVEKDPSCRGVIQVGDLVQGLCGGEALARIHCKAAVGSLFDLNLGVPVWVTKGNHDITGPAALQAYEEIVLPFSGEVGDESNSSRYALEEEGWLIVSYDGYSQGSLDWLETILAGRKPGRLLVIVHQPVVSYNARSSWGVHGHESQRVRRQRLVNLLGK